MLAPSTSALIASVILAAALGCARSASYSYDVPLSPASPWPKFRRNSAQDGRSPVAPRVTADAPWSYLTRKGIFSSPVIGGDGTIYIGSADRTFYALTSAGKLRWQFLTGEIIDSSALLDDRGRVYFGSGDGHVYALDAASGKSIWTFQADDPSNTKAFINWFEGNIGLGPDGDLIAPNDNYLVYSLDRDTGSERWAFNSHDQNWALPALDGKTSSLFAANNSLFGALGLGGNVFRIAPGGKPGWTAAALGSVAASPLLTAGGAVVIAGFDGYVRAFSAASGSPLWTFAARDHLYASPAQLDDGTLVQPSVDGTVYALDPQSGALRWSFEVGAPVRSSPAIDGAGNIYFGAGGGRLFALRRDGSLRWSMQLIDGERSDLNSSPALGTSAIYLGGESGEVFAIPYDYCLRSDGLNDSRCALPAPPADGAQLTYASGLGAAHPTPPATIDANQPLAFTFALRSGGKSQLALLDSNSLVVTAAPAADLDARVSGDRRFLTIVPRSGWIADSSGGVTLDVKADYLVGFDRNGLRFSGGSKGGSVHVTHSFQLTAASNQPFPLPIPAKAGDPAGAWELYRLAAPLPTILPSYNQIGFDSLHYFVSLVEPRAGGALAFVTGARRSADDSRTEIDPATQALFPLLLQYSGGLLTATNENGFAFEVMNATIAFRSFRLSTRLQAGSADSTGDLYVAAQCADIKVFGAFLQSLGYCNPDTDAFDVFGGALLRTRLEGPISPPANLGAVSISAAAGAVSASFTAPSLALAQHSLALLVLDDATGLPLPLGYGTGTARVADGSGNVRSVSISFDPATAPATLRVYLMVDGAVAARASVSSH